MFRQGKPRTFFHNLRLASLLSIVAGMVNITGVLSIQTLTTNVTGHFAFFAQEFVGTDYRRALIYILYIFFFLLGAFVCGFLVEAVLRKKPDISHAAPMFLEMTILILVAFTGYGYTLNAEWIAFGLLFSMGLQNALVTRISNATVRTTHLTGLFTDLGIELSQIFFYRDPDESRKLKRSIYLRMVIILFFFLGCVLGGFLFNEYNLKALIFAAGFLVLALMYDNIRYGLRYYLRRLQAGSKTGS